MGANPLDRVLGTTEEITTCDHCGRSDLKSTVIVGNGEEDPAHYGSTCYAKFVGVAVKDVRTAARSADLAREKSEKAARDRAWEAEFRQWEDFCKFSHGCGMLSCSGLLQWIACLGGGASAKAKYAEWKIRKAAAEEKRAESLSQAD